MPSPNVVDKVFEIELDSRQRLPLAKVIPSGQRRFRITALSSGDYLMTPVVSVSERELAVLRDPATMARITAGVEDAAHGRVAPLDMKTIRAAALAAADDPDAIQS